MRSVVATAFAMAFDPTVKGYIKIFIKLSSIRHVIAAQCTIHIYLYLCTTYNRGNRTKALVLKNLKHNLLLSTITILCTLPTTSANAVKAHFVYFIQINLCNIRMNDNNN